MCCALTMTGITQDRRLQLLPVTFCFGAFFEGTSDFQYIPAITAAIKSVSRVSSRWLQVCHDLRNTASRIWRVGHAYPSLWPVTGYRRSCYRAMTVRVNRSADATRNSG